MSKGELSAEDLYQFREVRAKWSLKDIMGILPNCVTYNTSIQTQLRQVRVLFIVMCWAGLQALSPRSRARSSPSQARP